MYARLPIWDIATFKAFYSSVGKDDIYHFVWEDQRKPQGNISYKALWRGHYKFIMPSSALCFIMNWL